MKLCQHAMHAVPFNCTTIYVMYCDNYSACCMTFLNRIEHCMKISGINSFHSTFTLLCIFCLFCICSLCSSSWLLVPQEHKNSFYLAHAHAYACAGVRTFAPLVLLSSLCSRIVDTCEQLACYTFIRRTCWEFISVHASSPS